MASATASGPAKPEWRGNCQRAPLIAIAVTEEAVPEGPRERSDRSADALLCGVPPSIRPNATGAASDASPGLAALAFDVHQPHYQVRLRPFEFCTRRSAEVLSDPIHYPTTQTPRVIPSCREHAPCSGSSAWTDESRGVAPWAARPDGSQGVPVCSSSGPVSTSCRGLCPLRLPSSGKRRHFHITFSPVASPPAILRAGYAEHWQPGCASVFQQHG